MLQVGLGQSSFLLRSRMEATDPFVGPCIAQLFTLLSHSDVSIAHRAIRCVSTLAEKCQRQSVDLQPPGQPPLVPPPLVEELLAILTREVMHAHLSYGVTSSTTIELLDFRFDTADISGQP